MYSIFQKCYNHVLQNMHILERNNIFIFSTYFSETVFTKHQRKINAIGMIKYKYNIFINHYKSQNTIGDYNENVLNIFCKSQKIYMALLKFKNICMWKKIYKSAGVVNTIEFDNIHDLQSNRIINIIEDNIMYTFSIYDLIKIINKSLTFHIELFSEPIKVKNPWTNKVFNYSSLLSIYHFIHFNSTPMSMPILLKRFFMANFNIVLFEMNNDFLIKDSILNNFHLQDSTELIKYINMMISHYNKKYIDNTIVFDPDFPKQVKINIMLPYLKHYVQYKFSSDEKTRQYHKTKLLYKLNNFRCSNRLTGRKIKSTSIHKLFKVSLLYYQSHELEKQYIQDKGGTIPPHLTNDNIMVKIPSINTYPIPSIYMIDLNNSCYWIGAKNINDYTIFVDVNKIQKNRKNVVHDDINKPTHSFRDFVKNYQFNTSQLFYFDKYLPHYISINNEKFKKKIVGRSLNNQISSRDGQRSSTPILYSDDDSEVEDVEIMYDISHHYVHTEIVSNTHVRQGDGEITQSDGEITQSDGEITQSDDEITQSDDEITLSDDEITLSDDDITLSDGEITQIHGEITQSDGEITQSDDDDSITIQSTFVNDINELYPYDTDTLSVSQMNIDEITLTDDDHDDYVVRNTINNTLYIRPSMNYDNIHVHMQPPSSELLDEIFGYDSDNNDIVEDSFNQHDLRNIQERIINSLPRSELNHHDNIQQLQTVFRPIDMSRINATTSPTQLMNSYDDPEISCYDDPDDDEEEDIE